MTGSVERRFLVIVGVAVLVFVVPLFVLFLGLATERSAKELHDNVAVLLAANAQALAKPMWDFDAEGVEQISTTVISAGSAMAIRVRDASGSIDVKIPVDVDLSAGDLRSIESDVIYKAVEGPKKVGTITLFYRNADALSTLRRTEGVFIAIFLVAVVVVLSAAVVGNRVTIIKPLLKLAAAIEATRRLGSRHHVDWHSNDEMGRLAQSFNGMQYQLEQEERELKMAHRRSTDIYNLTPAMLFSTDDRDRITAVSEYWLQATGYQRTDVIGRQFSELVAPDARDAYQKRRQAQEAGSIVLESTARFLCADGRIADMLIKEVSRYASDGEIRLSLSVMTDVTALKQSEARNHRQAITDHLTGLMNRQGFEAALDREIGETDAQGGELACLFIDLDRFKWINDNLGHQAGDSVLRMIVSLMQPLLPTGAVAARLGGDEFAILIRSPQAEDDAKLLSDRFCAMFNEPFAIAGASVRLSSSIGIAIYPRHAANASQLLQKSDMAMYRKKRDGKNGALIYDPGIEDSTRRRAEIERDIEAALTNDWLDAFFQPIVQLKSNRTVGFEALMRIRHPEKGVIPPSEIVGVAEETGAIIRIGNRMMEKALSNLVRLSEATGDDSTYLAINFSPLQFEASLPIRLANLVARFGIAPRRLVIEITEATLLHDNPLIRTILDDFSRLGCRIALDDFGTGYSSLSYLNRFPVDIVKIDQSFVASLSAPEAELRHKSRMLVEGITAISKKMRCVVIAEGIETDEQRNILKQFGVDNGQGYFFARPQPIEQMIDNHHNAVATANLSVG